MINKEEGLAFCGEMNERDVKAQGSKSRVEPVEMIPYSSLQRFSSLENPYSALE